MVKILIRFDAKAGLGLCLFLLVSAMSNTKEKMIFLNKQHRSRHYEPPHLDLYCLPCRLLTSQFCLDKTFFEMLRT